MTEPETALTKQYTALVEAENAKLEFTEDGVREIARIAALVNDRTENIGARRLHTVLERLLDEASFSASEVGPSDLQVDAAYVREKLQAITQDEDLSRYIL